jgi:hypothetical protein
VDGQASAVPAPKATLFDFACRYLGFFDVSLGMSRRSVRGGGFAELPVWAWVAKVVCGLLVWAIGCNLPNRLGWQSFPAQRQA